MRRIREAAGFEDVYALLGAPYVLEPSGSLDALPSSSFARIASCDAVELQYYRYSRAIWDRWFETVQHFNRVQRSEWLHIFEEARLACVSEEVDRHPIDPSVVHDDCRHLGEDVLTAVRLRLVSRRD